MRYFAVAVVCFQIAAGLAGVAFAQMKTNANDGPATTASPGDDRLPVAVTEPTRIFILAEMRGMLAAVQGVAEAAGRRDWPAAASAARKSGLKAFQGMPKQVMMELPEEFRALGRQSHSAFDALSDAAMASADPAIVSSKLAEALELCVGCHQTYRLSPKP